MTLTTLRESRGYSRKGLAVAAGIGLATWRAIEAGTDVRVSTLRKIAERLELPLATVVEAYEATRLEAASVTEPTRRRRGGG